MAKKLEQSTYENAKAKLDKTGNNIKQVAGQTGLGEMTLRRIAKSKNYKSYEALSRNAHVTKEQRALMQKGHTQAEAKAMLTTAKPEPGQHEVQPEPDVADQLIDPDDDPTTAKPKGESVLDNKPKTNTVRVRPATKQELEDELNQPMSAGEKVAIGVIAVLVLLGIYTIVTWLF